MMGEADLAKEVERFREVRVNTTIRNLQRRGINALYAPNRGEALSIVLSMIPAGVTVARADSVTLFQIGIIPELIRRNQNKIIDPYPEAWIPDVEQRRKLQREALLADVFLTGTNAITMDGKLVNIDGAGNRVSGIIFGPKKVIVVAGVNKIVKDVDEALKRIHNICAPLNAIRHYLKHNRKEFIDLPCVKTGYCTDCNHEWRICRYVVIVEGVSPRERGRINVVIVGEELGI